MTTTAAPADPEARRLHLAPAVDVHGTLGGEQPATTRARCSDGQGTLSHLFLSDDDHELARAKSICGPCGLRPSCLSGAIQRGEPYGVWGGKILLGGSRSSSGASGGVRRSAQRRF